MNDAASPTAAVALPCRLAGKMRAWSSGNTAAAAQAKLAAAEARVARRNAKVAERERKGIRWHVRRMVRDVSKITGGDEDRAVAVVQETLSQFTKDIILRQSSND